MMTIAFHALSPDRPSANRLLAALPWAEYLRLLPYLEPVPLPYQQILYDARQPIPYVWFVEHGVVSLVRAMKDGTLLEIAVIGCEGMVGLPVFIGTGSALVQALVQIPGVGLRPESGQWPGLACSRYPGRPGGPPSLRCRLRRFRSSRRPA